MTLLVSSIVLSLLGTAPESVLISEVAYDVVDEASGEWLELVNLSDTTVSLDDLRVGDEETRGGPEAMLAFPVGTTLEPWANVVVASSAAGFFAATGMHPDFEVKATVETVAKMSFDRTLGGARFELANGNDEILLLDVSGTLIDGVSWGTAPAMAGVRKTAVTASAQTITRPFSATNGPEVWRAGTPTPHAVVISGLSGSTPTEGEGEGEEVPVGEGEGEEVPVGEGEGEGEEVPVGEGEGEGEAPRGEGEGEGEPDNDGGISLGEDRPEPVVGPPESDGCTQHGGGSGLFAGALLSGLLLRRRR